jgi:hypothetical protein
MLIGQQLPFNNKWMTLRLQNPQPMSISTKITDNFSLYRFLQQLNIADDCIGLCLTV